LPQRIELGRLVPHHPEVVGAYISDPLGVLQRRQPAADRLVEILNQVQIAHHLPSDPSDLGILPKRQQLLLEVRRSAEGIDVVQGATPSGFLVESTLVLCTPTRLF
jgi:hypothetical protein